MQSAGGAKNFMVVLPDADLDSSIAAVMGSAYGCAGERCMAGSVLVCAEGSSERFLEPLCDAARSFHVGPTDRDPNVQMGPVVTQRHLDNIYKHIENGLEEGADLRVDGRDVVVEDTPNGFYLGPTIFDNVTPQMSIAREEIFGPVVGVTTFKDEAEALAIANDTEYGLGAGVWTRDMNRAYRMGRGIQAGRVWTNCYHAYPAHAAFGGYKKSGIGRETHKMMLDHYQQTKNLLVSYSTSPLGFF